MAALVWIVTLLAAAKAEAAATVTYTCTPAPVDCSGWFRSDVAIDWTVTPPEAAVTGCVDTTLTVDTPGTNQACSADDGTGPVAVEVTVRVDKTPPEVTAARPERPANANGWFNGPVRFAIDGSDATSGIADCPAVTYAGPDSATASIAATCVDNAGNAANHDFALSYDATGPEVTGGQPERPPDHAGWFVRPVRFDFTGTDATSGLDACPPATYTGPDGAGVEVAGRCRDRAGNTTSRAFSLNYDTLPPLLTLAGTSGDRSVSLTWQTSPDVESVEVRRTPGFGTDPVSVAFHGPGTSFVDRRVENGTRYAYEVRVSDAAGNASAQTVIAIPAPPPLGFVSEPVAPSSVTAPGAPHRPRTIKPAAGSVFLAGAAPLLEWPRARRASYYNVQLLRRGRKLLSVWPTRARYQLKPSWTFRGRRHRLSPGRYRWIVWPGYGRRAKARYGDPVVRSTFRIRSAAAARTSF